jgi:exodeoxyribonuclease-1
MNDNQFEIFYDTETTGPEPKFDQVLQYAAIRTDADFEELDTVDIRSQMSPHMLPTPGALKVTHVDPYEIARAPFTPYAYARHVHGMLANWLTDGLTDFSGWNIINYDEEIMRQMFWQNLMDPYLSSGKGKRRVDYLLMARALYARNPNIIDIPINEETGKNNFKLENIATLNGFMGHNAHDALGDVRATIHMARLIRDVDPHLFYHAKLMGQAQTATQFVEDEKLFRILGGQMVNPGILDVVHITNQSDNPKAKVAWNLAVDPTPYLGLEPAEILKAMRKSGTPFRNVKCHKQPMIFPMGWEFLQHAAGTEAPTPDLIDERANLVMENIDFQRNVQKAVDMKIEGYDAPVYLEEKIYSGFPSWADKTKMKNFHDAADWGRKLDIARSFEMKTLKELGLRLVWANAPEVLSDTHRNAITKAVNETRFTMDVDNAPWTTLGSFMKELAEWEEKMPGDEELANIRNWVEETFPQVTGKVAVEADGPDQPTGPDAHFLDGID